MNINTTADVLATDCPMTLDLEFDSSCPCGTITGQDFEIHFHCWRVCFDCKFSGIHVTGDISDELKQQLGEHVRDNNPWTDYTDWEISFEQRNRNL